MVTRYERDDEVVPLALKRLSRSVANANRATGTEIRQTADTAEQAATDSTFARELAEQLEAEIGPLPGQVQEALDEAAAAIAAAGLAQSAAVTAVADAAQALADSAQAIENAQAAADIASGALTWETRAPVLSDADGKAVGATWFETSPGGTTLAVWSLTALGWVSTPFDETIIPQIAIGSGTYGQLFGGRLVADSVTALQIAALTITAAELAADAVTAVKIAAGAVTTVKLDAGAVTTAKLDALAVTAEKIAAGAIIAEKIAAGAITTAKLAADAIDGMTITGALIRTAASGARMQFDVNGLRGFNASDVETVRLRVDGDGLELTQDADYAKAILGLSANKTFGSLISALSQTQNASFSLSAEGNAASLSIGSTAGPGGGSSVVIAADGSQNWVRSDSYRNGTGALSAPYASAGGVVPKQAIAPAAATSVTVTFPPSRFTVAPIVTTGLWGAAKDCAVNVDEITSTSCKIWLGSNSAASRTFGAQWQAVQMLATSASG